MSRRATIPPPGWGDEPLRLDPQAAALERRIATTRPHPPAEVADDVPERFAPDPIFAEWIRGTFVAGGAPLANEDHAHLLDARVGVLWTNSINVRQMRHVLATAEIPQTMGGAWKRGRAEQQLRDWFEFEPDFLLTFYAPECRTLDDRAFCALVEHELYHCAQAEDQYGSPKFERETGRPIFGIRAHDVEEFTGVVRRYGPTSSDVRELVKAAGQTPILSGGAIARACGTCQLRAA